MTKKLLVFVFIFAFISILLTGITTPEKFLGFKVGDDGKLIHYNVIMKYFLEVFEVKLFKQCFQVQNQLLRQVFLVKRLYLI